MSEMNAETEAWRKAVERVKARGDDASGHPGGVHRWGWLERDGKWFKACDVCGAPPGAGR